MKFTKQEFEKEFENLNNFYTMRNPEEVHNFIKENEGLIELLNETKPHLLKKFPNGEFELQAHDDITGEEYHKIYLNIFVDDETFNNGIMEGIHEVHGQILPLKRDLDLIMKLVLMPGVKGY
jgi:hypothetical protein